MKITKGVIAAAGKGTRFLPETRVVPKEMLPIVDKPVIQYIVEEFVEAGIKEIVIVTSEDSSLVESHFSPNPELETHLRHHGKTALLARMRNITRLARLHFVRQKGPYGNGSPCLDAQKIIGQHPFAYALGDDLILAKQSFTNQMCEAYRKHPGIYLGAQTVPRQDIHKYGIMRIKKGSNLSEITGIVEKPEAASAPSNIAAIGRYILPPEIFPVLAKKRLGRGGELWLVDAVSELIARGQKAFYKKIEEGKWYTTGDPVNYLTAVRAFALARPELKNQLKHIFR